MKKLLAFGLGVLALTLCFACDLKDDGQYVPAPPNAEDAGGGASDNGANGGNNGGGSLGDDELPMVPFH